MMQSEYKPDFPLPKMFPLEQVFPGRDTDFEYVTAVQKALEPLRFRVKPGMRVGLAVGSDGSSFFGLGWADGSSGSN